MADARQNRDSSSVPSSTARASRASTVCMTPPPQQPKLSEEEIATAAAVVMRAGDLQKKVAELEEDLQQPKLSEEEIAAAAAVVMRAGELQKKVDELEDNLQRACRAAHMAEMRAEAAEDRLDSKVGVKESLDEEKACSTDLKKKLEEEKRRVSDLTHQNCILSKDLAARDDRINDLTSKIAKNVRVPPVRRRVRQFATSSEDSDGEDEQRLKRSKTEESDGEVNKAVEDKKKKPRSMNSNALRLRQFFGSSPSASVKKVERSKKKAVEDKKKQPRSMNLNARRLRKFFGSSPSASDD